MVAIACGVGVASALGIGAILRPEPWFDPQYLIPLVGMVTGNTMNASALAAERFIDVVLEDAHLIESLLALGLSGGRILEHHRRQALRAALMPTINTMMVVGIVSLPGMMTGQILAGASPHHAVRYQMLIHSLIVVGAILGSFLSVHSLSKRLIINERLAWISARST
jgi:putative ABC transport system permease protein